MPVAPSVAVRLQANVPARFEASISSCARPFGPPSASPGKPKSRRVLQRAGRKPPTTVARPEGWSGCAELRFAIECLDIDRLSYAACMRLACEKPAAALRARLKTRRDHVRTNEAPAGPAHPAARVPRGERPDARRSGPAVCHT